MGGRVERRSPSAEGDAGDPADRGKEHRLTKKLLEDVPAGSAERTPEADLAAALEHGDHHDVGYPEAAHEQHHQAQAEE